MSSKKTIVQISDTHLFGDVNKSLNGANSYSNLCKVLSHLKGISQGVDLIICTGDLSQDCTTASYKHLLDLLEKTDIKYHLIPGNHDDVDLINKVFNFNWVKNKVDYSFMFNGWYFYFIDSSEFPKDGGFITIEQLADFSKSLNKNVNAPTLVFLHHHPIQINSQWMDNMTLNLSSEFNEIVKNNPQIKAVLFGHIHQVFEAMIDKTFYASAPSTCFQVKSTSDNFALDRTFPGFRLIELDEDKFSSKVVWVE